MTQTIYTDLEQPRGYQAIEIKDEAHKLELIHLYRDYDYEITANLFIVRGKL